MEHLRSAVANEHIWNNIKSIKLIVKQMIKDYVQLTDPSSNKSQSTVDYDTSDATLYADIHRIRRYFHHVAKTLNSVSYLHPKAVKLAIEETRKTYDDDGNVLNTIESYLRTFCLEKLQSDGQGHKQKLPEWEAEKKRLEEENVTLRQKVAIAEAEAEGSISKVRVQKTSLNNIEREYHRAFAEAEELIKQTATLDRSQASRDWIQKREQAKKKKAKAEENLKKAKDRLEEAEAELVLTTTPIRKNQCKIVENEAKIQDLQTFLDIDGEAAQRKLYVKYGRGLLLYGPPGTG